MSEILRALQHNGLQPGEIVPVTYWEGDIVEGQPAGAGWSVTRVYGDFDVYHQGDPGLDELEQALSAAMRRVAGISDDLTNAEKGLFARVIAGTRDTAGEGWMRMKLTEAGIQKFKPRRGAWAMTLLYDYFEVYHQPSMAHEVLEQALAEAVKLDPDHRWDKLINP